MMWEEPKPTEHSNLPSNRRIQPLPMDSSAYSFTAFAGVPAMEFSFVEVRLPGPAPEQQPLSLSAPCPCASTLCPCRMARHTRFCTRRTTRMKTCTRRCGAVCQPWPRLWPSLQGSSSSGSVTITCCPSTSAATGTWSSGTSAASTSSLGTLRSKMPTPLTRSRVGGHYIPLKGCPGQAV